MSDFPSLTPSTGQPATEGLLHAVLDVSLTALSLLRPIHSTGGKLLDFALDYLNPVAQRLTGLPQHPAATLQARFPAAFANGIFSFCQRVYETGEPDQQAFPYQAEGGATVVQVAARRHHEQLVVSFLETAGSSRTAEETALRASPRREQAPRLEAEAEHSLLQALLTQAPVAISLFQGPELRIAAANHPMAAIWGRSPEQVLGRPLLEALPELEGQGFDEQLRQVLATQVPVTGTEVGAQLERDGRRQTTYYNFVCQPLYDTQGQVLGVVNVAVEVTEQVLARQQVQQLNEELEMRVNARSAEARAAQHEAEQQREETRLQKALLGQILGQVPAAIATLSGPEHRFSFFNEPYQVLSAGRTVLGHTVAEVFPEVVEQGFISLLDQVYATGQPFVGTETLTMLHNQATGQAEQRYIDFIYQPLVDGQQRTQGILAFILDVTARVQNRKQAETLQAAMLGVLKRQAQARQDLYQIFEQASPAIVLLREPDHRIDYFNPAFAELFPPEGWPGTLQGHTIAEVYPRVKMAGLVQLLDKVFSTGESQVVLDMPLSELQPGSPRYVTFSYQAYREEGRIVGVAAFAYDVTEQVLARLSREAQQTELQRIFELAPVAISVYRGPDYVLEFVNPPLAGIIGNTPEQMLGQPLAKFLPDMREQGLQQILDSVRTTGEPFVAQELPLTVVRNQNQELGYFNFVYQQLPASQGQESGVICVATEVTGQVRARQLAEAAAGQLRLLTDALPVLIGYLDRSLTYRFANQAYQSWFNQDPAALIGQPVREVVGEVAFQAARPYMERALAGEQVNFDARMPYRENFVRHIRTSYIPDEQNGEVVGFYTLVSDVSEQVLARQQVQQLNEELAAINQEMQATNEELKNTNTQLMRTNADLDTFVYSASHDLKAPITNVEGLMLALREHLPANALENPLVPRLLDLMGGAVARFQQTLAHLTDVSRLQQTVLDQPVEEINLPALVEDVRLDILPELTAAAATLTVDLAACPTVRFSPKNLRSIIYNLLSNAVKYRDPARPALVQLRGHRAAGQVVLSVQDNGLGLTEEQQTELFRMFRRLHSHVPGSGVGLYMIRKMVENAGGSITISSQPGVGSTFTVSLPYAE